MNEIDLDKTDLDDTLENIDDSKVGVVTLQFRNYLHSADTKYAMARLKVNTTYSQIESKPNAPFLSLYMQLGSNKWKVEKLDEPPPLKKPENLDSVHEPADAHEARLKYQMAIAVFGIDYPFFDTITDSVMNPEGEMIKKELKELLESHPDPIKYYKTNN